MTFKETFEALTDMRCPFTLVKDGQVVCSIEPEEDMVCCGWVLDAECTGGNRITIRGDFLTCVTVNGLDIEAYDLVGWSGGSGRCTPPVENADTVYAIRGGVPDFKVMGRDDIPLSGDVLDRLTEAWRAEKEAESLLAKAHDAWMAETESVQRLRGLLNEEDKEAEE